MLDKLDDELKNLAECACPAHLRRMRMGNRDRRAVPEVGACVVCGSTDTRVLSFTRLREGERVTVCGSHKTAHHRSELIARTVEELCALVGERRKAG